MDEIATTFLRCKDYKEFFLNICIGKVRVVKHVV